jgi:D-2-hydroxyacid dehydrogenase (NADP+)
MTQVSPPPLLALNVELPPHLLERVAQAAEGIELAGRAELRSDPSILDRAEILFALHMNPERIARSPSLRWVQTYGAGVEWLLTPEVVQKAELRITNASGVHAQCIAEHVFGMMLSFARKLHIAERQQLAKSWDPVPLRQGLGTLAGKTLGILGLGAIGKRTAEIGAAFGMRVVGYRRDPSALPGVAHVYGERELERVLAESDYVVNALPLTRVTRNLIGVRELAAMRPHAFFVNIGRGATVDTDALVDALANGKLGGAGLDVTAPEPLPPAHPLWTFENVIITPHYSGAHPGYEEQITSIFVDNLRRYRRGEPLLNLVDKAAGY